MSPHPHLALFSAVMSKSRPLLDSSGPRSLTNIPASPKPVLIQFSHIFCFLTLCFHIMSIFTLPLTAQTSPAHRRSHCSQGNMKSSKPDRPECLHFTWTCSRASVGKSSLHVSHSWNFTSANEVKNRKVCIQGLLQETSQTCALLSVSATPHMHRDRRSILGDMANKGEAKSK